MSSPAVLDERDAAPATRSLIAKVEPMTTARALRGPFDYRLPETLADEVDVGSMLVVPFGRRQVLGVVVGLSDSSDLAEEKLLAPLRVLDDGRPAVPRELRRARGVDRRRVLLDACARAVAGAAAGCDTPSERAQAPRRGAPASTCRSACAAGAPQS